MSPRQLFEKLEALGIIDPTILEKIRKEIDNPEKTVKPKAVLSYLVKKNQITEQQAKLILKADPDPKPKPTEDEIEVVQPVEKSYDTNDLMGLTPEDILEPDVPVVEPTVKPTVTHDATMIDDGGFANQIDPDIVVSQDAYEAEPFDEVQNIAYDGLGDDEGFDQGYESGGYETQSGKQKILPSFKGKRDKSDQWATKWLYIGFGILGTLLIGTAILWIVNMGQKPEDMYQAAMDSFNKGSWADAAKKYDEYLERFPKHKDAPDARAYRVNSILRGTYGLKNWSEVIQQADTLLPDLEAEGEKLSLIRDDLAVLLPRSLAEISEKSTKVIDLPTMETDLAKIEGYFEIVDNPVYIPTSGRKPPSVNDNYMKIDNNIRMIRGQIDKEKRYIADLGTIRELKSAKKTDEAFGIFQKLTRNYGDLASREELRTLMLEISETEKELVVPIEIDSVTSNQDRPSMIQSTVVLAVKNGQPVPGLKEEIVCFLADGAVYGVDAGDGTIVWRRFVGFETDNQPVALDGETILLSNQRDHDLIAVNKNSGQLKWRTEIKEPFFLPTVDEQAIILTTASGKVIELSAVTGVVAKAVQLPQPATLPAIVTRDRYIYQLGSYQNLYVLSSQDLSCSEVKYIGHYNGSVSIPPQAWTGHILIAINGGDSCSLHVLKPKTKGLELDLVQVMSGVVKGTVSIPIERLNRWALLTSDSGVMQILELFPDDEENPVQPLSQDLFDAKGGQQVFLNSDGSNLWVAGMGIMRYKVQRNLGSLNREVPMEPNDTFICPVFKLDDYVMHVRRRNNSGMISVSLVDALSLKPVWRTDFGGEMASPPISYENKIVAVSSQGDMFTIDEATEAKGYSDTPLRASEVLEDLIFHDTVQIDEQTFAVVGPAGRKDFLIARGSTGQSKLLTFEKPADQPSALPLAIGNNLLVPTQSGPVALINPANGRTVGTPFLPPTQSGSNRQWFEPTLLGNGIVAIGAGPTEASKSALFILSAEDPSVVKKIAELELETPIKSRLVNDGNRIFGVVGGDAGDKLTAFTNANPPAVGGQVDLAGGISEGPWLTTAGILVRLDNDKLYCFGNDLSPKWSIDLPNEKMACEPSIAGANLMLCFQSGNVSLIDPSTGKPGMGFSVGQPIIHKPLRAGEKMYFSGLDGTVHVVDLKKLTQ